MNSHEVFIHIHQGCFAGTGAIVRLPQCQWSKPDGYGKISQCITTTKHSKAKTVCIFLGIHCTFRIVHKTIKLQCINFYLLICNVFRGECIYVWFISFTIRRGHIEISIIIRESYYAICAWYHMFLCLSIHSRSKYFEIYQYQKSKAYFRCPWFRENGHIPFERACCSFCLFAACMWL